MILVFLKVSSKYYIIVTRNKASLIEIVGKNSLWTFTHVITFIVIMHKGMESQQDGVASEELCKLWEAAPPHVHTCTVEK